MSIINFIILNEFTFIMMDYLVVYTFITLYRL